MPYPRFLAWNAAASIVWTAAVISAGYLLGRNVETLVSRVSLAIAAVVVAGAAIWWLVRRRHRRSNESTPR